MSESGDYLYVPSWPIFYQDNHLLALYKPAGLLVQGDQSGQVSLLDLGKGWIRQTCRKPGRVFLGLVHRLDRPVAGVMLFCKTSKAARRLSEQFRSGTVEKTYTAVVEGVVGEAAGRLVHHIERRDKLSRIVASATAHTQEARLSYRVLDRSAARSLVEIQLETGRRHQIRLQLAQIGHPILGDGRYGASVLLPQRQIALFAHQLAVDHPIRNERLSLRSPLPRGWPWKVENAWEERPLWNWDDIYPLMGSSADAANPCSVLKSVQE